MSSETIPALLKKFAKQPGCEAYKGDAKKNSLLHLYLFLRRLSPTLTFEVFLDGFAYFADADAMNLKMPEDAAKHHLPSTEKRATELNVHQWTAKQIYGFTSLYVDMVREAEAAGIEPPKTYLEWIENASLREQFLAGAFDEVAAPVEATPSAETPAIPKRTSKGRTKASKAETRPTDANQRIIYAHPSGQHIRGLTTKVEIAPEAEGGRTYVSFMDDSGQLHEGISITAVSVIPDPPPQKPQNVSPEAMLIKEDIVITLEPDELTRSTAWLQAKDPGKHEPGIALWEWSDVISQEGVEYTLFIKLINADEQSGAYVDAYAVHTEAPDGAETVVFELVPRNFALLGAYMFVLPHGTVRVTIEKEAELEPVAA